MKLSHHTKVIVRKALAALRSQDREEDTIRNSGDSTPDSSAHMNQMFGKAEQRVAVKAGFQSRTQLESFARKHHLL